MLRLNPRTPQVAIGILLALIGVVLLASTPGGAEGDVTVLAEGALAVAPAQIEFGQVAHPDEPEAIVSLTNRSDEPVKVLGVEAS